MNIAIFSDIHGNLPALNLVLEDIRQRQVDRILCLGDLVDGGTHNNAVVDIIRQYNIQTVVGNHDTLNECVITSINREWLLSLPESIIENAIIYTHVSPRTRKKLIIADAIEAWNVFDEEKFRLCFIGHTHCPLLYGEKSDNFCEARSYTMDDGLFTLSNDDRYIISFGAVGYPRRGGNYIRYGIYNTGVDTLEFIKLHGPLLPYGSNRP